ncbi:MAG: YraN family protein [Clostridia bacterium]|nr:YraN family protein [Clostridia bacterium]
MAVNGNGGIGESYAARYLIDKGYTVLASNYSCRFGEIDIIASKGGIVAFVEVKTRVSDSFAKAMESVNAEKLRRIVTTAGLWISQNNPGLQPRFDVIEVYLDRRSGKPPRIEHIENVWTGR